ncbi:MULTISPECIES: tautomerase family protein [Salinicola]|uniref:4-oxalocrotonate tautomerase n=1 Tax=Salinicola socius TaxID=404433 RepID=A0A1Q8SQN9_9GAMM|nr:MULTISPECIES: tautomerase family protein [Salinicola]OLO03736.1 4-oxalocrotonate tautomerase [Salinicola socius]
MPIVTIQQFPRDVEQKRELAERVTDAFVQAYGISAESVQIFFHETDKEDWARGGRLGIDEG